MRWSGFHKRPHAERLDLVARHAGLDAEARAALSAASALELEQAEAFVENAVGSYPVPLGFAVGFVIDGRDVVVPMAVEESSVIAAASHGAKLAAAGGGFTTLAMDPVQLGQLEIRCTDAEAPGLLAHIEAHAQAACKTLNGLIPGMVARGGGVHRITAYAVPGRVVALLHVGVGDAMGANVVNTVCEAAWDALEVPAGTQGLRILSNHLPDHRHATATCRVPVDVLGGAEVAEAMVAAWDFAVQDPFRAATHNKGILNGIDPVVVATGNDWRAVEAGTHAFAAKDGQYRGLGHYAVDGDHLVATLAVPLAVGTVGGVTRLHPVARACLQVLGVTHGTDLARILVAVGLAQNLSALRALATEGIQRGHMALHARNVAMQAGLTGVEAERVAARMVADGPVSVQRARELAQDPS